MIKTLLRSLLFQISLKWQAQRLEGKPSALAHAVPRLNLPGEAANGEKFRLDCARCGVAMEWLEEGFSCPVCQAGFRTRDAALIFIEAGLEMLRAADRLDAYDPAPAKGTDERNPEED